jgi:primosomal protein N'
VDTERGLPGRRLRDTVSLSTPTPVTLTLIAMIARVTLEIALRREFDYLVPPEFEGRVEVGTRVKVPFGRRQVLGVVTALVEESPHTNLRAILRVIGRQSLVTPKVLALARWIADYYCCAPETALRSVLPDAVRKEEEGWRERLFVRLAPPGGELPKLTKRQQEVLNLIEERRELPLQELLHLAETTADTVRRLEDKGLVVIATQVSERDPYAHEQIVASQSLALNVEQASALERIIQAMQRAVPGGTRVPRVASGVTPDAGSATPYQPVSELTARRRHLPHFEIPGRIYHITWRTHGGLKLTPPALESTLAACHFWHGKKLRCLIACVMPDHVHLLVQPLPMKGADWSTVHPLSELLHSIKSFSAHEVNKVMQRTGPVWDDESFDRMIRSETDLHEKWNYIWNNPREAGLVGPMEEYPFVWTPAAPGAGAGEMNASLPPGVRQDAEPDPRDAGATHKPRDAGATPTTTFLLHGVTGSGKTEVYLQAIAHVLEQGRGAIVLVPEISLTPQTVERFKARFSHGPNRTLVAVLHSHLSAGERHDEWHKIRQGRARIVIGARSAIFAPIEPLGLIIVDEEHEHSYKQEEAPRYHARDVAVVRGRREGAVVVLGSATPSLESYHNVTRGKYELLELPHRADHKTMPLVRVVDMRQEARKEKGTPIFSLQLKEAITQRLEKKEQVMLFLNRRGYATSMQCPKCGYVAECPNCSVALTYHRRAQRLLCHICGHDTPAPAVCPASKCRNPAIRYAGLGTEKVEDTLTKLFPHASIRRMDSDVLKRKDDYRHILGDFKRGKIDILVGTQMIAKGLHFENVTLVGVIYADLSLHQADFRAGERTFQLLTQVAGRAGRGAVEGEVFVQAFTPFHPAIQYARRHDFTGFYDQEIEFREQLKYPPVGRVALLTLKGRNEDKVKFAADHLRKELEQVQRGDAVPAKGRKGETAKRRGGDDTRVAPGKASTDTPHPPVGHPLPSSDEGRGRGEGCSTEETGLFALDDTSQQPAALPVTGAGSISDLIIAGPAPSPLLRAETFYRYQIMLRTRQMSRLSQRLAALNERLTLPEDVSLTIDIDPVNMV